MTNLEQRKDILKSLLGCIKVSSTLSPNSFEMAKTGASLDTKLDMILNNQSQLLLNDSLTMAVIASVIDDEAEDELKGDYLSPKTLNYVEDRFINLLNHFMINGESIAGDTIVNLTGFLMNIITNNPISEAPKVDEEIE